LPVFVKDRAGSALITAAAHFHVRCLMNKPLKISIACGYSALVVGSAIFWVWLIAHYLFQWNPANLKPLVYAGIFWTYAGGPFVVFVGFCCLAIGTYQWIKDPTQPRLVRASIKSLSILVSNFVIAGIYLWSFIFVSTLYSVRVINNSTGAIANVHIFGGGVDKNVGPLLPGSQQTVRFHFSLDGSLSCRIERDGKIKEAKIEGYVTGNFGGNKILEIESDGGINVSP